MKEIDKIREAIENAKRITVLTGAGVSTSSGIPDFQSTDAAWEKEVSRTTVISRGFFERRPKEFWGYYKDVFQLKLMGDYEPNPVHLYLKELEEQGKEVHIFTQNVDGLHQKAGNKHVYEMHGTIQSATCPKCKRVYDLEHINAQTVPRCTKTNGKGNVCNFILKPNAVLFGDSVKHFNDCLDSVYESQLLLVLGTSLEVYPVNTIPKTIKYASLIQKAIVNLSPTIMDHYFTIVSHMDLLEAVEELKKIEKRSISLL